MIFRKLLLIVEFITQNSMEYFQQRKMGLFTTTQSKSNYSNVQILTAQSAHIQILHNQLELFVTHVDRDTNLIKQRKPASILIQEFKP